MKMKENIVAKLIWKDDRCACTLADKMIYSLFFSVRTFIKEKRQNSGTIHLEDFAVFVY
ncbi:hypothetical protein [Sellimonas intestinalis]|uniref:hypothetical protein n=1 Tax=Sellimonas intestinalis TaxID=1653434 RepID=UPI00399FE4CF